ncbi:hypothetical protein BVRB_032690, partial [Beta vulgaris subsp. vulgaris]
MLSSLTAAEVFKYSNENIQRDSLVDFGLSLIAPSEGSKATIAGNIHFDQPPDDQRPISVAVIGMKPTDIPRLQEAMGIKLSENRQPNFCCDSDLISAGKCTSADRD